MQYYLVDPQPYFLCPSFLAVYPFALKTARVKAVLGRLVPGIPLDDGLNPDDDTVAAAVAYLHIADHYIWKGADYVPTDREWLKKFPPQLDAIEWASKRYGVEPRVCDLLDWIPVEIDHNTFWTDESLLYASENPSLKLDEIDLDKITYTPTDYSSEDWSNPTCNKPKEMIKVLRKALKIDFHPDCKERITHAIGLMIDDLKQL